MKPTYHWQPQYNIGQAGEQIALAQLTHFRKSKDLRYDIWHPQTGVTMEIKTENYYLDTIASRVPPPLNPRSITSNLFFERISNKNAQTIGGPWRSQAHGINVYVHYFLKSGATTWFCELSRLVAFLENYIQTHAIPLKDVKNGTYVTQGYTISLLDIPKDLYTIHLNHFLP